MILPSKHLPEERALLTLGGTILGLLDQPKTVSMLWNQMKHHRQEGAAIPFDWFVLALDLLAIVHAIHLDGNRITRGHK